MRMGKRMGKRTNKIREYLIMRDYKDTQIPIYITDNYEPFNIGERFEIYVIYEDGRIESLYDVCHR